MVCHQKKIKPFFGRWKYFGETVPQWPNGYNNGRWPDHPTIGGSNPGSPKVKDSFAFKEPTDNRTQLRADIIGRVSDRSH